MAWLRLEDSFRAHPKIRRLARTLDITRPEARGYLTAFWAWAVTNAPDGDLSQFDPEDIAEAADWPGDATVFFDALRHDRHRFIDDDPLRIHDWLDYAEGFKRGRQKAEQRARRKADREGVAGRSPDSRRTVAAENVLGDGTGRDETGREKKRASAPARSATRALGEYVEAWNRGLDDAAEDLGRSPNVSRARPGAPPGELKNAVKDHPEPEAWRWCAYALATSWEATKTEDPFDGFGLAWLVNKGKKRIRGRMEAGAAAREQGRTKKAPARGAIDFEWVEPAADDGAEVHELPRAVGAEP